jgi:tetratricopeptide (TPR) repeat protein
VYAEIVRVLAQLAELPRAADTDDEAAVETQRRRVALDLNNVGARVALGTASLELGDNAGAVMELLAALLIDPGHVEANAALAQASLRLDDHAGAVVAARRALEGHPNHPGAQYVLATALTRQGNAEEAALAFERYRRMLDDAQVARRRDFELDRLLVDAREHATRGAIDDAVASLRAGMALRPEDPALPLSVGLLLLNGQRPQEAIAALEAALALGAGPEAHQHLAAAYDALGRPEDARRHQETFERSLVRAPRP